MSNVNSKNDAKTISLEDLETLEEAELSKVGGAGKTANEPSTKGAMHAVGVMNPRMLAGQYAH